MEFFKQLIAINQWDLIFLIAFSLGLFWSLMLLSKWSPYDQFFMGVDGKRSVKSLCGVYLVVSFATYTGAIAFAKNELLDFPWAVVILIIGLLGLASIERVFGIYKGVSLPADTTKVTTESTSTVTTTEPPK